MGTLILAVVCIILLLVLYVVSGGWKKYGGIMGIFKWMKAGGQTGSSQSGARFQLQKWNQTTSPANEVRTSPSSQGEEEVIQVLRDVYSDFDLRYSQLKQRVEALELENRQLVQQVHELLVNQGKTLISKTDHQEASGTTATTVDAATQHAASLAQLREILRADHEVDPLANEKDKYFEILDMLEEGHSEREIAAALSIDEQQVSYVRNIMAGPNSADRTNQ